MTLINAHLKVCVVLLEMASITFTVQLNVSHNSEIHMTLINAHLKVCVVLLEMASITFTVQLNITTQRSILL